MVTDALSRKSASSFIGSLCMRISNYLPLLYLISEAQVEGVKKQNRKQERIGGEIDKFSTDRHGLLT